VSTRFAVLIGGFTSEGISKPIVIFTFAREQETIQRLLDEHRTSLVHVDKNVPIDIEVWENCVDAVLPLERIIV